jgi:glycosyltransferase involved in cell wall biosynthesis
LDVKVLHVIPSVSARHGGPTEAVWGTVRALRSQGVDARILSTDDDRDDRLQVPLGRWTCHEGLPTYFIRRVAARQHTLAGFTFAPGLIPVLWREISNFDFIHVHTVFSFPAIASMLLARVRRCPYVVRPMGHLNAWSLNVRRQIKQLQLQLITRRNLNSAAFLHATSEAEGRDAVGLGLRCPVRVIPLGVTIPKPIEGARQKLRERLSIDQAKMVALFLSRVHEKKGLEFLLEALTYPDATDVELVICGDGEPSYIATLGRFVEQAGLTKRVHWLGFLRPPEKWEVAEGCDFFVLPSYSENFGIAVVEALACGLFAIVSPDVAIAADVSQAGIGCTVPRDSAALAQAISKCIKSERFDAVGRSMRRGFVEERFSWAASAKQLIIAYQEVLAERHISTVEQPASLAE